MTAIDKGPRVVSPPVSYTHLDVYKRQRQAHGNDNSWRHSLPDAVAFPQDREQIVALVRTCRRHQVPLVARGSGTGTTGAAVPTAGGVVVSFAHMNHIIAIRPEDRCVVVEPGVLNGDLQRALASHGLFWPPDPSSADQCSCLLYTSRCV